MLKPSDFNNAVPQFSNGNYASNPINPQYVEEPSSTDYNRGTEPLQTLPAQWWNWFMNKFTSRFNKVNIYVKNLFNELAQLLSLVNVTPDGTEGDVTDGQLKNAFKELYPDYINTKLALESTYVKKTQKVNNHALSGDVTVTKSDVGLGNVPNVPTNDQTPTYTEASTLSALSSGEKLSIAFEKLAKAVSSLISHIGNTSNPHSVTKAQVGLGNVVNTGDSATPVENGTTKFTTGGAYTLKKDLTDIAESLPTDAVLHYSFDDVPDYPDGSANVRLINNNTYGLQSTNYFIHDNSGTVIGNENGNIKCTITGGVWTGCYISASAIQNKIVKIRIKVTDIVGTLGISVDSDAIGNLKSITEKGVYDVVELHPTASGNNQLFFLCVGNGNSCTFTVEQIYIGDGSYSTPIIDNANGQRNSISQSGVAVQGVSGKGFNIPALSSCAVKANFTLSPPYTHSLWLYIKPFSNSQYAIDGRKSNNDTNTDEGIVITPNGGIETGSNNGGLASVTAGAISPNVWQHIAISCENINGGNKYTFYKNGVKIKEQSTTAVNIGYRELTVGARYYESQVVIDAKVEKTIDDLLIFDRALTETEVMALYLNKANTPKYYGEVPVTRTINDYPLNKDIVITKSDVSLGNVVNTGDSAIPLSNGTTKFTTGGAYSLLTSLAPIFSTSTSYAVGDMVTYNGRLYTCTTVHSAGAWNASDFTVANLNTEFQKPANNIAEDFQINKTYEKGQLVIYNKELYKCKQTTYVQLTEWDATKFQRVSMYTKSSDRATSLTRYVFNVSLGGQTHLASLPALCAGSELFIRLDNDNNRSGEIRLEAYHAYTLGVTYSDGGMSTLQKLTSGQELSITVAPNSYLEVSVNYIDVDEQGIASFTMFTYPIPSVDHS